MSRESIRFEKRSPAKLEVEPCDGIATSCSWRRIRWFSVASGCVLRFVTVQQLLELLETESAGFGDVGHDADPTNTVFHGYIACKHQIST
jgi:hypothetical protein